jgi:putative transposase
MARLGRYFLAEQPLHVIQRGNNREATFHCDEDYERYREWLAAAAADNGCAIHAYVLMTNHVHLLVTPDAPAGVPRMVQTLGRRYVRYVNVSYGRTGTLWEGRYRAAPIDSDAYFLSCCRYIELNPVRAGMVRHPRNYAWWSYRAHALGKADALVSDHGLYRALGRSSADRQGAYRELFRTPLRAICSSGTISTRSRWWKTARCWGS